MSQRIRLQNFHIILSASLIALALTGCSSPNTRDVGYTGSVPRFEDRPTGGLTRVAKNPNTATAEQDGPPGPGPALDSIPDATPKVEPLAKYGNPPSYFAEGVEYSVMKSNKGYVERGMASWYGRKFEGKRTSSGEPYDPWGMTAAHTRLPLPTYARVTNLENGKSVVVKINDRGPFRKSRVLDLSYAAAQKLDVAANGTAYVEVRAIDPTAPDKVPAIATNTAKAPKSISAPKTKASNVKIAATTKAADKMERRHYLQIAAFAQKQYAENLRQKLVADITESKIEINTSQTNGNSLYRVRIGPFASAKASARTQQTLHNLGITSPQIVAE